MLPHFRYHPFPVLNGNIIPSSTVCVVCKQKRSYVYSGPVYAPKDYHDRICPYCISSGEAHSKLDVMFTDDEMIGGGGMWESVEKHVIDEVAYRTPGFCGWQQEIWFTHCHDAGAFLGVVGFAELSVLEPEVSDWFWDMYSHLDQQEFTRFYRALDKDGSPRAYLFQCLHCGTYGGYTDAD